MATSLVDGRERWFTYGPAVDAVLASAAMPAIFPPVEIDGERYIDGGVVDNVPIQRAIDAGATRIVVLLCSPPVFEPPVARRPVEGMVNALFIAIHARFVRDMAHLPDVEVVLCSAGAPGDGPGLRRLLEPPSTSPWAARSGRGRPPVCWGGRVRARHRPPSAGAAHARLATSRAGADRNSATSAPTSPAIARYLRAGGRRAATARRPGR